MQKRLFFLKQDGWVEAEVSAKLLNSPGEELFRWTYAMMDKYGYRNYLITENPGPVFGRYSVISNRYSVISIRYSVIGIRYQIVDANSLFVTIFDILKSVFSRRDAFGRTPNNE